jgi:hypothetical protein
MGEVIKTSAIQVNNSIKLKKMVYYFSKAKNIKNIWKKGSRN